LGCGKKVEYSPSGKGHFGTSPSGHLSTSGVVGSSVIVVVVVEGAVVVVVVVVGFDMHPASHG